jgi:hypothetical protein
VVFFLLFRRCCDWCIAILLVRGNTILPFRRLAADATWRLLDIGWCANATTGTSLFCAWRGLQRTVVLALRMWRCCRLWWRFMTSAGVDVCGAVTALCRFL